MQTGVKVPSWLGMALVTFAVISASVLTPRLIWGGVALVGFGLIFWGDHSRPVPTPLDGPVVLLILMGGVSALVTPFPEVTCVQLARLAAGLAIFYAVVNWTRTSERLQLLVVALILAGVALAAVAPVAVDWNRTKSVLIPASVYDLFPLLLEDAVHPNIMASALLLFFPLSITCFLKERILVKRLLWGGIVVLLGSVLVLTKSRGGYIAAAISFVTVLALSGRVWRRWALLFGVLVVVGGIWFVTADLGSTPDLVEGAADPSTFAFRQEVWRTALWMMNDFCFTGAGMGTFNDVAALLYPFYEQQNPGTHNLYLQVGVDLGIPGLIAMLSALLLTLWLAGESVRCFAQEDGWRGRAAVGGTAALVGWLAHGLIDNALWGSKASFAPWLMMGLLVTLRVHFSSEAPEATVDQSAD